MELEKQKGVEFFQSLSPRVFRSQRLMNVEPG
jgi:hypothetical protein